MELRGNAATPDSRRAIVPWKPQSAERGLPIVRAEGVYFWDSSGKRFLDFTSQFVFANFGHGERRVMTAIREQLETVPVMASSFATDAQTEAATLLAEIAPGDLDRVFFSTSGAEANEAAIKMARDITGRPIIVSRYRSYHGSTFGAMTLSRDPRSWPYEPGIPNVVYAPACYPYRCRHAPLGGSHADCGEHSAQEFEELILNVGADRVAAVIVEPIVGSNGVIVPADGYLQRVQDFCRHHGILLIADEVMTGFGRTGRMFACEHWGVAPDLMTVAKGLTGGYVPFAGTLVRGSLAGVWDERPFLHGHTYSNHALGSAAATAAIKVYREDRLPQRAAEIGDYLSERAHELQDRHPSVGDVRGKGLFVGLELVRSRRSKEPISPAAKERVLSQTMTGGVYQMAGQGNVLFMAPPLTISRAQIDEGIAVIDSALELADRETQPA